MEHPVSLSPQRTRRRLRVLAWVALASMLAVVTLGPSAAGALAATSLHQTPPISSAAPAFQGDLDECAGLNLAAGQVLWHFVLVQTADSLAGSTLTATFTNAGTITVNAYKKSGGVLHFNVTTGADTLTGASTNRNGKWLNLSHICQGPPLTTTTTSTTTTSTTTSSTTTTSTSTTTSGPPPTQCNTSTLSGGEGTTVTVHELGQTSGTFNFSYNTYSVPDEIVIRYEGNIVYQTGGPVSVTGVTVPVSFGPGASTTVTVTVIGPAGTVWDYIVNCPTPAS